MRTNLPLSHCPSTIHWDSGTLSKSNVEWRIIGRKQAMFSLHSNCLLCEATKPPSVPPFLLHKNSLDKSVIRTRQTKEKRRGGRPKGAPSLVRHYTIGVRVNEQERELLQNKAEHMGMSLGEWLRIAALQRRLPSPPIAPINRKLYGELARLGSNINQLTRRAHSGFLDVDMQILEDLRCAIARLQRDVITPEKNIVGAS